MSYIIKLTDEVIAALKEMQLSPETLECIRRQLAQLGDDPVGSSRPLDYPWPGGQTFGFQCSQTFFTFLLKYGQNEQTLWIVDVRKDR